MMVPGYLVSHRMPRPGGGSGGSSLSLPLFSQGLRARAGVSSARIELIEKMKTRWAAWAASTKTVVARTASSCGLRTAREITQHGTLISFTPRNQTGSIGENIERAVKSVIVKFG